MRQRRAGGHDLGAADDEARVGLPLDVHVHDSYFVVAHFHYTLVAGSVFGLFAGLYYWFPKMTGLMYDERLGRLQFGLMTVGTNVAFLPMFWLGYQGMPRRIATYPADSGFAAMNLVSSIGAFLFGLSILVLIYNLFHSFGVRRPAGADPWCGTTLEWVERSRVFKTDLSKLVENLIELTSDLRSVTGKVRTPEGEKLMKLLYTLLQRLEPLDAQRIREFLQKEGIKVQLF